MGAWIETVIGGKLSDWLKSHPVWVRGLKLNLLAACIFLH